MRVQSASMRVSLFTVAVVLGALVPVGAPRAAESAGSVANEALKAQVRDTERAFAKTMADRDFTRFVSFISPEAIFFSGDTPLRGRAEVAAAWKGFFKGKDAPFSWEPDKVEVLSSGTLALSSGPVHDAAGKLIATFTSTWRRERSGVWRIVFDKGCDVAAGIP